MPDLSKLRELIGAGPGDTPQAGADAPSARFDIGARLKALRVKADLSLSAVATASGVSKSNVSKIENGLISPTFEMMEKISHGLGVPTSVLLSRGNPGQIGISLTRNGQGIEMDDPQYQFEFLFSELQDRRMVPFVTTVTSEGRTSKAPATHKGEEFFYVLSGAVDFMSGDNERIAMGPGDAVYFDSNTPHLVVNRTSEQSKLLWVWLE